MKVSTKLSLKLIVPIFIVSLVFAGSLAYMLSIQVKENMLQFASGKVAVAVRFWAEKELDELAFLGNKYLEKQMAFEAFARDLKREGLTNVKLWNARGVVIYDEQGALTGKEMVMSEQWTKASKAMAGEPQHGKMTKIGNRLHMLTYIPISFGDSKVVMGVVQGMLDVDPFRGTLSQVQLAVASIALAGFLVFFLFVFWSIRRLVLNPAEKLDMVSKMVAGGEFSQVKIDKKKVPDNELGDVTIRLERVAEAMKVLKNSGEDLKRFSDKLEKEFREAAQYVRSSIHEINNLMLVISGYAEMLSKDQSKDQDTRDTCRLILEEGNKVISITRGVSNFFKERTVVKDTTKPGK